MDQASWLTNEEALPPRAIRGTKHDWAERTEGLLGWAELQARRRKSDEYEAAPLRGNRFVFVPCPLGFGARVSGLELRWCAWADDGGLRSCFSFQLRSRPSKQP